MSRKQLVPTAELLDESLELSFDELCRSCVIHREVVIEMVQFGILNPRGRAPGTWRFSGRDLLRVKQAIRLQRDLDINLAGVALVIDLLEERNALRARLRRYTRPA